MSETNTNTSKKDAIYKEKIQPLAQQIFELCEEHDITMISSFSISDKGDKSYMATSIRNANREDKGSLLFARAAAALNGNPLMGASPLMGFLAAMADGECQCVSCKKERKAEAEQEPECTCSKESKQEAETEKADK